ncbi:MAG: Glutamyl-tRNA(Gln) amidotransferase subunit A, partial [Parcubacteria group bacterium GW2011_GWB1_41_4]
LDFKKLKIGLPKEFFEIGGIDPDVKNLILKSVDCFKQQGAEVLEINLPHMKYSVPAYYIINSAEISANLARYDGIRYPISNRDEASGFREIYYKTKGHGFSPYPAFKIGEKMNDPVSMYLADIYTGLVNMACLNGLSVPCGFVERENKKLPVGLQIIGNYFNEELVLRVGNSFEQEHNYLNQTAE